MLHRDTVTVYYDKCTEPIHTLLTQHGLCINSHALELGLTYVHRRQLGVQGIENQIGGVKNMKLCD